MQILTERVEVRVLEGGREFAHVGKMDRQGGNYESGDIYFFKHRAKKCSVVIPRYVKLPDGRQVEAEYPFIIGERGLRIVAVYPGTTTAAFLYGEYKGDPGDAVTAIHVTHAFEKAEKVIVGTGIPWGLVIIGALVVAAIVFLVIHFGGSSNVPVAPVKKATELLKCLL